jgi:hypothetical protein
MRKRFGWALAALLASSSAFAQTQEAVAQARFNKGRELFIANQYAPALVEFRAASELYESPNTRLYIGRCERELGHVAAAYVEFARAANEAADRAAADPRYASTRDVAKQEVATLEKKLAHVVVLAPAGLPDGVTITVNGAPLGPAGVGVAAPIDPGPVEVVAKANGYVTARKNATAAAGESIEVKIQLEKEAVSSGSGSGIGTGTTTNTNTGTSTSTGTNDTVIVRDEPRASHGLRNAGFVVGAVGIAGMGVFAAFAALAQTRFDQLKQQCGDVPCDPSANPKIDEGQTFQNIANIALVAGGVAILTGGIMIVAGISTSRPTTTASIVPLVGGGFMAGVTRAF